MRILVTALALAVLVVLAGCGEADEPAAPEADEPQPDEPEDETPVADDGDDTAIGGTLAGDAQLEGGCVWLEVDDTRYEVLWPEGWEASADPVELRDPDGEVVARAGDPVRVQGREADDIATICQVGPVFEATEVDTG